MKAAMKAAMDERAAVKVVKTVPVKPFKTKVNRAK
jgi:hypothetical protein